MPEDTNAYYDKLARETATETIRKLADEKEELQMQINKIKQWARESEHTNNDPDECLRCQILHKV